MPAAPPRGAAEPALADLVRAAGDAARQGIEVRDGEHDAPVGPGHARHLADGHERAVEVVDRPLADHAVEAVIAEGQGVGPGANPLRQRALGLRTLERRECGHARRRLGPHRPGTAPRHGDRVLPEAAGDVQHPATCAWPRQIEGAERHPSEEVFAVAGRPRGDDIAHVPVEIHHPH